MTFPNSEDDHDAESEYAEVLAAYGLYVAPADAEQCAAREALCYLWPCNLPTFNVWQRVQTQWAYDASGQRTGLRYQDVMAFMDRLRLVKPKDFDACFAGLQAMEFAALQAWGEQVRER